MDLKKNEKKIYYPSWDLNPDPEIAMPVLYNCAIHYPYELVTTNSIQMQTLNQ